MGGCGRRESCGMDGGGGGSEHLRRERYRRGWGCRGIFVVEVVGRRSRRGSSSSRRSRIPGGSYDSYPLLYLRPRRRRCLVNLKSFVVLIIGHSQSNHLGAQGTVKPRSRKQEVGLTPTR